MTTTTALPLTSGTWTLDPTHSSVEFTVRHLGLAKVRGNFTSFDASLVVGDDLATSKVTAAIDLASVDTGNADRDAHLQSTDFFDSATHPRMTFESTSITGDGEAYVLVGDLALNGVTRSVALDVEFFGTTVSPLDQTTRSGFTATGAISRKDFGMEFNVALGGDKYLVSDKVNIEINVELIAPAPTS
jgi:polyisoprenoid-binding protein YceI